MVYGGVFVFAHARLRVMVLGTWWACHAYLVTCRLFTCVHLRVCAGNLVKRNMTHDMTSLVIDWMTDISVLSMHRRFMLDSKSFQARVYVQ